jgi:Dehydrogenase E1 component
MTAADMRGTPGITFPEFSGSAFTAPATDSWSPAPLTAQPNPPKPVPTPLTREQERAAYREMLLIRRFEEKAGQLYGMGFIGGFCHLYIGQEAVVVGLQMAAKPGDQSSPPTAITATCWPPAWTRKA